MYTLIIEDKNGVIADEFSFDRGTYLIGRVEGNDIILPSSNVSRQHARLFIRDSGCFVEDLGSSNGVIVDGQRISGERDLGSAAQIRVGDYYLYLEFNRDVADSREDVVSTHIVSQGSGAYKLVRVGDAFAGEEFVLGERQNTIGRTDENYILLNDPSISRRHSRIDNDGLVYTLQDLGSSNGSRVNGKRITSATILKENDRVSFGNVDFIFAPGGRHIDPSDFAKKGKSQGRSKLGIILVIVVLLMLTCFLFSGLSGGAYYYFYVYLPAHAKPEVPQITEAQQAEKYVQDGRALMSDGKWSDAIDAFDKAINLDEEQEDAASLKEQAEKELKAQELFDKAQEAKSKQRYEEAKEKFEEIDRGTGVYESAEKEINDLNLILADSLKKKGGDAYRAGDYDLARESLSKSIELRCDDEAFAIIRKAEGKMKKNKRKYGKVEPFTLPAKCRKSP